MKFKSLERVLPQKTGRCFAATFVFILLLLDGATLAFAQNQPGSVKTAVPSVDVVRVVSQQLLGTERLPAELTPWQVVAIYPKVQGFVERIDVDRGSTVREGQILAQLSAPELLAQTAQAQATTVGDQATYRRLLKASHTPGSVSANELELAEQAYKSDQERVRSLKTLAGYLTIRAPFSGIITERNVHPGAFVGPPSEPLAVAVPMLRLEQIDHLRLVVPVPQADADLIPEGGTVKFTSSAFPGRYFAGTISRISHALDPATRTMPVEADVYQKQHLLDPGMFVEALWPVETTTPSLFVPGSAIGGGPNPFVESVSNGRVQRVSVTRGKVMGDLVRVFGQLAAGDLVMAKPSANLPDGERVRARIIAGGR
jgi:membrane fusion protein (multidrug efflux system)